MKPKPCSPAYALNNYVSVNACARLCACVEEVKEEITANPNSTQEYDKMVQV